MKIKLDYVRLREPPDSNDALGTAGMKNEGNPRWLLTLDTDLRVIEFVKQAVGETEDSHRELYRGETPLENVRHYVRSKTKQETKGQKP